MLPSLTIAIPAFNEAETIESVAKEALRVGHKVTKDLEILLIDDGSTDATPKIIDKLKKEYIEIHVVHHVHNKGFSGAMKSCYTNAHKEWIFLAPGDGQIKIEDITRFIEKSETADVLVGFRTSNPEPFNRKVNSFVFHSLYRALFGVRLKQISTAILWRTKTIQSITITAADRSASIQPEVIYKAWKKGARFAEIGIPSYARKGGTPKGSDPMMIFLTIKELLRLWWEVRIRDSETVRQ
jgi:glycosyltransferase involved in cell wall biosynthesis